LKENYFMALSFNRVSLAAGGTALVLAGVAALSLTATPEPDFSSSQKDRGDMQSPRTQAVWLNLSLSQQDREDMKNPQAQVVWLNKQLPRMEQLTAIFETMAANNKSLSSQSCFDGSLYAAHVDLTRSSALLKYAGGTVQNALDALPPPLEPDLPDAAKAKKISERFSNALRLVCL
jgi:hypothetical protein